MIIAQGLLSQNAYSADRESYCNAGEHHHNLPEVVFESGLVWCHLMLV